MDPLSIAAGVIAIIQLTSNVVSYLDNIRHAPKDRERLVLEASSLLNLLRSLRYRIEDATKGDGVDPSWYTAMRGLTVANGPLQQYRSALEQLSTSLKPSHSTAHKLGQALTWKFTKDEITSILSSIERVKSIVGIALTMDHLKLTEAVRSDLKGVSTSLTVITSDTAALREESATERFRAVLDWLSPTDHSQRLNDICSVQHQGTGSWLFQHPLLLSWADSIGSTLYCPGDPGTGKSVLSGLVVLNRLESALPASDAVTYLFCDYQQQAQQTASGLLSILLRQLTASKGYVLPPVRQLHDECMSMRKFRSLEALLQTVMAVAEHFNRVYLIIDALDELSISTRYELLPVLKALLSSGNFNILVTSRQVPDISKVFTRDPKIMIRASDYDIRLFASNYVKELPACVQNDAGLQESIVSTIESVTDGIFILARLHLEAFRSRRNVKAVKTLLSQLVPGSDYSAYDQAYDSAVQRIQNQAYEDCDLALRALSWMTYAQRPLTALELQYALAIEVDGQGVDPDNFVDVAELLSLCAGLAVVDVRGETVRLVHFTTHEYMLRHIPTLLADGRVNIAHACITYLRFAPCLPDWRPSRSLTDGVASSSEQPHVRGSHRLLTGDFTLPESEELTAGSVIHDSNQFDPCLLLQYVSAYWGAHARDLPADADGGASAAYHEDALSFLQDRKAVASAARALHHYTGKGEELATGTGVHLLAYFGCHALIAACIRDSSNIDPPNAMGDTPLSTACKEGHGIAVATLLHSERVNVNSRNRFGQTPLFIAVKSQRPAIVDILLASPGIQVDAADMWSRTPLIVAARLGNFPLVRRLLLAGAAANKTGSDGKSAMFFALLQGKAELIDLLFAHGADLTSINAFDTSVAVDPACRDAFQAMKLFQPIRLLAMDRQKLHADLYNVNSVGGMALLKEFFLVSGNSGLDALRLAVLERAVRSENLRASHAIDQRLSGRATITRARILPNDKKAYEVRVVSGGPGNPSIFEVRGEDIAGRQFDVQKSSEQWKRDLLVVPNGLGFALDATRRGSPNFALDAARIPPSWNLTLGQE